MRSIAIRSSNRPLQLRRTPLLASLEGGRWLGAGSWIATGVWLGVGPRFGTGVWLGASVRGAGSWLGAGVWLAATTASATPHAAHHHYMIGTRANYGMSVTKVLHHEASAAGIDLTLAKSNLETAMALASEIREWTDRTEQAQPEAELGLVREDLAKMRGLTTAIERLATTLITTIDATLAQPLPAGQAMHAPSDELSTSLVSASREIFQLFREILRAHKNAENAVGIPVPQDPPESTTSP